MNDLHSRSGSIGNSEDNSGSRKKAILARLLADQSDTIRRRNRRFRAASITVFGLMLATLVVFLSWPEDLGKSHADRGSSHARDASATSGISNFRAVSPSPASGFIKIVRTDPGIGRMVIESSSPDREISLIEHVPDSELSELLNEHAPDLFVAEIGGRKVILSRKRAQQKSGRL